MHWIPWILLVWGAALTLAGYLTGRAPRGWLSFDKEQQIFETPNGFEIQWFQRADGITQVERRLRYEWVPAPQMSLTA